MDRAEIEAAFDRLQTAEDPELRVLGGTGPARLRRIGLVPGSFDPMTVAHAALAGALRTEGCDVVILVLSARTLPKEPALGAAVVPPLLEPAERVASLLAYGRRRSWLRVGLASHGLLVDQVDAAGRAFPGAEIVVGMGSDKLLQLLDPRWYEDHTAALGRLFRIASVGYALRGDEAAGADDLREAERSLGDRLFKLVLPPGVTRISSRAVRSAEGAAAVERWVPAEVRAFLRRARGI